MPKARQDAPERVKWASSMGMLDNWESMIKSSRKEARQEIRNAFPDELSAVYLAAMVAGSWGLGLTASVRETANPEDYPGDVLPPEFINDRAKPDPNLLAAAHFTSICNQCLAIATLVESGLEKTARPLVRTLQEFCCLVLVISSDQQKARDHHAAQTIEEERAVFYKHFTPRKLNRAVTELEDRFDFIDFGGYRLDEHEHYTRSVHVTSLLGALSAYAGSLEDDERLEYALFGRASSAASKTLHHTATTVWHVLHMFQLIVEQVHGRSIPKENPFLMAALGSKQALDQAIIILAKSSLESMGYKVVPRHA